MFIASLGLEKKQNFLILEDLQFPFGRQVLEERSAAARPLLQGQGRERQRAWASGLCQQELPALALRPPETPGSLQGEDHGWGTDARGRVGSFKGANSKRRSL